MRIAITGSIGSGKSEVGRILTRLGHPVIDADAVTAEVLKRGTEVYGLLVETYGEDILDPDGDINKPFLADLIFQSPHDKEKVESLMHPAIWHEIDVRCAVYSASKLVFVEVPLLFETNSQGRFDRNIVVLAEQEIALQRLMECRHIERDEAFRRWESQMDPVLKMELADDVIINEGNLDELEIAVQNYLKKLEKLR
jgi:dephospho-CoA kinase